MPKSLTKDTILAMSTVPESSFNAMVVLASGMTPLVTRSAGLPTPTPENSDDRGVIGNQQEGARQQRVGFIQPPTWEISDVVNADTLVPQCRRFFGAADQVTVIEAGIAHQHVITKLPNNTAAGRQLPSTTFAYINNGLDYVYGGAVGNTLQFSQTGAADPTFAIGYVASGKYKRVRDISPAYGTIAAPAALNYMNGPDTYLEFTDGAGTVGLTAARRLKSITCNVNNVINSGDRYAGNSRVDPLDKTKGWHLDELLHGDRDQDGAEMVITLDDTMREFLDASNNTIITSFKLRFRGYDIPTTATASEYLAEVQFRKCYFRGVRFTDDNGDACLAITVFPVINATTFGITEMRFINGVATAIT